MTKIELRELYLRYLDEATANGVATTTEQRADYKDKFDYFLNGALLYVAGQIKTVKEYNIAHSPLTNTYPNGKAMQSVGSGITTIEGTGKSCYFEVSGTVTIRIYHNNLLVYTEANTGGFNTIKRFLSATSAPVTIQFTSDYAYAIKNIAIYDSVVSALSTDVPAYGKYVSYTMPVDFREVKTIEREDVNGNRQEYTKYIRQTNNVIALPYDETGEFTIRYYSNPTAVTPLTLDATVIDVPDKALSLVALKTAYDATLSENSSLASWLKGIFDNELANTVTNEIDGPRSVVSVYTM